MTLAGALFLLDPGEARQGNPHRTVVDVEADVDGVGVARGDGYDVGLPAAVQVFAGPEVGDVEVFVHAFKRNGCGCYEQALGLIRAPGDGFGAAETPCLSLFSYPGYQPFLR